MLELWTKLELLRVRYQQKFSYLFIIATLLAILGIGHRTHWNFFGAQHHAAVEHVKPVIKVQSNGSSTVVAEKLENDMVPISPSSLEKAGIQLGRVERRTMHTDLLVNGLVQYNQNLRAQLATRVPGNVWRVEKHVGEMIHKGDVLAIIEASEVGRAKGELLQAVVQWEMKTNTAERLKSLEVVAERQRLEAAAAAREAQIEAHICAQSLVNMGLPVKLADLQGLSDEDRAKRIQFLGLPDSIIATLHPESTTSSLVPLIAPFDGVVIGHETTVGEVMSPSLPHFEIADIRTMWLMLEVRKEHVNAVKLGQTVNFEPDGFAGEITGKIDWISTAVDEKTRTLQVRAQVENPIISDNARGGTRHLLPAYTFGTGSIRVRENDDSLVVPTDAVQFHGDSHFVFVREREQFRRVRVQPGVIDDGYTEVVGDLQEGLIVATEGSHVVMSEMQIAAAMNSP